MELEHPAVSTTIRMRAAQQSQDPQGILQSSDFESVCYSDSREESKDGYLTYHLACDFTSLWQRGAFLVDRCHPWSSLNCPTEVIKMEISCERDEACEPEAG